MLLLSFRANVLEMLLLRESRSGLWAGSFGYRDSIQGLTTSSKLKRDEDGDSTEENPEYVERLDFVRLDEGLRMFGPSSISVRGFEMDCSSDLLDGGINVLPGPHSWLGSGAVRGSSIYSLA